jgi:Ethanolamine utilization protein EutJ (predicted chaperonin)
MSIPNYYAKFISQICTYIQYTCVTLESPVWLGIDISTTQVVPLTSSRTAGVTPL